MSTRQTLVGCEREDGTLNIHLESQTCEICDPPKDANECDCAECIAREIKRQKRAYRGEFLVENP